MSETGETGDNAAPRRAGKRDSAFRTIGEVAEDLDLPAHVLRFWESRFPQLKPLKRGGGRRYYRPEDILLLRRIRQCLYQDGYTIRGVQKLLSDGGPGGDGAPPMPDAARSPSLFPLGSDLDAAADEPDGNAKPPRRPAVRQLTPEVEPETKPEIKPETKKVLEEIRQELLEARALLEELARRPRGGS